jgi:hypothetical protein
LIHLIRTCGLDIFQNLRHHLEWDAQKRLLAN